MSRLSVLLVAGWICLLVLHPHDLFVEAGVTNVVEVSPKWDPIGSRRIAIEGDNFTLDGKPLHIVSGSVHYFRMPAEYWRDRLRKVKAAGFNAIATYVEWSYHEPERRQYRFEGDYDVEKFVRLAAEEGLLVLLRPGPYICAERDLGGLPYWLLHKYPHIKLRTTDKDFIGETKVWFAKLFEKLTPLLYGNGGPIILVQVENEYGSYGRDMSYKEQLRDIMEEHVNEKALLYTTDGFYQAMIRDGMIPRTLTTIDFGVANDLRKVFGPLRQLMPEGPLMNSEFYPGWLTHWSESLQQVDKDKVVRSLKDMIDNKINVNMYVFFGGTNFEFSAGANDMMNGYVPDITSYDYDAPLNEAGDPTPKYYAIRELMETYDPNLKNISLPTPAPKGSYGKISLQLQVNLLSTEGRSQLGKRYKNVTGSLLPTFEKLKQRAGLVLYETTMPKGEGYLNIKKPRDRVYVYINGDLKGVIDRLFKHYQLWLKLDVDSTLSLLVESQGRINFGLKLHDFKGILNNLYFNGTWAVTGYPLEALSPSIMATDQPSTNKGPTIYKGTFVLPEGPPLDTFIDPTGWGKGYIWVNGHNLGRYWPSVGPQVTLYVPGVWLHAAPQQNTVQVLELERTSDNLEVNFIDYPILNRSSSQARLADPNTLIYGTNN